MRFRWVTRTDVGRVRDHNEDAAWPPTDGETGDLVVIGVADGMGGHAGGEVASSIALNTATTVGGDPAMRIQAANLAVVDAARLRPRLSGMGTTMTLAVFDPAGSVDIGHVGDSRAYLLRDGELERITTDHSYVAQLIEAGTLTSEEAEDHPYRSVLTRAVGLDPTVEVDTYRLDLRPGDRLLLCSDGLTSMVHEDDLKPLVGTLDLEAAADGLVEAANRAGGADNITVVLVDVSE